MQRRRLFPPPEALRSMPEGYAFIEPTQADVLELARQDPEIDLSAEFVRAAFQRGDSCFATTHHGRLVAYCWFSSSGSVPLDEHLCIVIDAPADAYAYNMATHPRYRGQRLQQRNTVQVDARALERGYTHVVGYVDSHNFSSRRALSRLPGMEPAGFVAALRIFGRTCTWQSPAAKRHGVRLEPRTCAADSVEAAAGGSSIP